MGWIVAVWLLGMGDDDRRTGLLRTVSLWPGIAAIVATGVAHPVVWISAAAGSAPYLLARLMGQVGGGDVKLAFVVGGLAADPMTSLLVIAAAQAVTLFGSWTTDRNRRPHGPALGGTAAVLVATG